MAEEQTKPALTPEQIAQVQNDIHEERNKIIDRIMPHFYDEDSLPGCSEAAKYFSAYFVMQLIEGHRMSGSDVNPDVILESWFEGFKAEVMHIHSQLLMAPAAITPEDLAKLH